MEQERAEEKEAARSSQRGQIRTMKEQERGGSK